MAKQISEEYWSDLLTSISLNECILILGPNISVPSGDDTPPEPLISQFARQLAQLLPPEKINDPANLSHVTEVFNREKSSLTRVKGMLQTFYSRDHLPPLALEHLTHLPFRLIINTAPDDLICKAYLKRHINFHAHLYNFDQSGTQEEPNYDSQDETPFIYNLFGSYTLPGSVVLTESQQVEFVEQIIQKEHKIPNSIQAVFRQSRNYLFLGFDFSDWYIRLLLSALNPKEEIKIPTSFAMQSGSAVLSPTEEAFFGQRFKLNFFAEDIDTFTAELKQRWVQKNSPAQAPTLQNKTENGLNVMLLYADKNIEWQNTFIENAGALPRKHRLQFAEVGLGDDIADKMRELMQTSEIIIPLVTAAFLNQYYDIWEQQLLPLYKEGKVVIVPVLTEDTLWDSLPEIETMPILPRTKKPVGSWENKPEAWQHIMTELATILDNL